MKLIEIHSKSPKAPKIEQPLRVLSLDPGGTVGYCISLIDIEDFKIEDAGQVDSTFTELYNLINIRGPYDFVLCESYRLYQEKANAQINSTFQTPRYIGSVEYLCWSKGTKFGTQSAAIGKQFVTDKRLKEWGYYQVSNRHANDAIRHICSWMIFGAPIRIDYIERNEVNQQ